MIKKKWDFFRHFEVANHRFCVSGDAEYLVLMQNYEPFFSSPESGEGKCVFSLTINRGEAPTYKEELRIEENGREIICGRNVENEVVFEYRWWNETAGWLVCAKDFNKGRLITTDRYTKMVIDSGLKLLFALATARMGTAVFHASTVSYNGQGYMFLGVSGTGKSTHAKLWLQYIEGTALVNDDNPIVRVFGEKEMNAMVFGSPWSGKTPCYCNISYPIGGIVLLNQASYNKIYRLRVVQAYAPLMSSISGMRWDERVADGLHQTENALTSLVPVWYLDCLPDKEAAMLCCKTISYY